MNSQEELLREIEVNYAVQEARLELLAHGDKQVYRVQHASRPDWILRARPLSPQTYNANAFQNMAATLLFLASHGYAAERVICALDGDSVVHANGWELLLTTYVGESLQTWAPAQGDSTMSPTVVQSTETLAELAAALGKLHALPLDNAVVLPVAGMLPRNELAFAARRLKAIDEPLTAERQLEYDVLANALQTINRCEDLNTVLIHNDPNLGNAARTAGGTLALIDWDVAGLGPAVIDIGALLGNCIRADYQPDREAIEAVVDGYCQHRLLPKDELMRLSDATRFQTLVLLAATFPDRATGKVTDNQRIYGATYPEWRAKYAASEKIARVAAARFARFV